MEPYESLANAIVMQAIKDYRSALRNLKKRPDSRGYQTEVRILERFFRSDWYGEITSLNAEYLIRRVNEEVQRNDS
jgi:hypothetical protein